MPKTSVGFRTVKDLSSGSKGRLTSAKALIRIERSYQIIEMRRDGRTHREIAEALNISTNLVSEILKEVLNKTIIATRETVEEEKQLQLMQIDRLLVTYMKLATEIQKIPILTKDGTTVLIEQPPNPAYAGVVTRLMERRAKLLALDTPEQKKAEETGIRVYVGVNMDMV